MTDLAQQWLMLDDEVEPLEIELLDGRRERAAGTGDSSAATQRQPLDERRVDAQPLDGGRHRPAHVHQREQLRVAEALAQHLERLFRRPRMPGQPVVDERDPAAT